MKKITFEIHYVGGMKDELYSNNILICKPIVSIIFYFDEDDLVVLGIQCVSQLIHHVKTVNQSVKSMISEFGMERFSVNTTYIRQQDYLLAFTEDKTLEQVFSYFHTEQLTLIHFFVAGGGSFECNGYRFTVHSNEKAHMHMPHVHVIKDKKSVRYSLNTLCPIDKRSRTFIRDEKKIILPALKKNLPRLKQMWAEAMEGYRLPEIDFDEKQYYPES